MDGFTCPETRRIDFATDDQDEFIPFFAELGDPAGVAAEYDAARFEWVEGERTAVLRLGNSDGSLGSVTTYQRSGDSWAPVRAVVCGGRDSSVAPPTADALRLGRHGTRPYPPRGLLAPRDDVEPVFVDDRSTYNHAGIVAGHGTLYAFPDGAGLTMVRGTPTSGVTGRLRASATRIEDASDFLFDPDHLVGRVNPFRMWAAYDRTGAIQTLVVSLRDGSTIRGRTFTHPSWDGGVLHLVLAPRETAESVRVVPAAR